MTEVVNKFLDALLMNCICIAQSTYKVLPRTWVIQGTVIDLRFLKVVFVINQNTKKADLSLVSIKSGTFGSKKTSCISFKPTV